ncbi:MAG: hypothetical protein Q4G66_09005 [bacterium]|nr:hypothetical protein [bacterium]
MKKAKAFDKAEWLHLPTLTLVSEAPAVKKALGYGSRVLPGAALVNTVRFAAKTMWKNSLREKSPHAQGKNPAPQNTFKTATSHSIYKNIADFLEKSDRLPWKKEPNGKGVAFHHPIAMHRQGKTIRE